MFLRTSIRTEASFQPVNILQEQRSSVKGLPSASTENKPLNSSFESSDKTSKRRSDQIVYDNPYSNEITEGHYLNLFLNNVALMDKPDS